MKHAGPQALARLDGLLSAIRALAAGRLKEKAPGVFYLRSRAFLHFHEDPGGLYADLWQPGAAEFVRVGVDGEDRRAALPAAVREALGS